MEGNYANPKAIKAKGNVEINSGTLCVTTKQNGGEGIESKKALTINGGNIEVMAYDDCMNAVDRITVNGGTIYCFSEGNDGIDCNGPLEFNGGLVISSGTRMPEEGFDCDRNTFSINGGTLIGTGGATSSPTDASCTQNSIIISGKGKKDTILQVKTKSGDTLVYKLPRDYAAGGFGGPQGGNFGGPPPGSGDNTNRPQRPDRGGDHAFGPPGGGGPGGMNTTSGPMTLLFSAPEIESGSSCTLISGATVSGGTEFHGFYSGATVTGGTVVKTFVTEKSSTVTVVETNPTEDEE